MFEGFESRRLAVSETEINLRVGGAGPALLLLHGYPQTHVMWHKIAPALAERFTVVCADLRGYGDSGKPESGPPGSEAGHAAYSKRAMARDQAEVMTALGFERFSVVGHDRGARVTHRLLLDHGARVDKAAVLDIAPTLDMYERTDRFFAQAYYHWFFLIQPFDLPERMIGGDPDYYLERKIGAWSKVGGCFTEEALAEYKRCFRDPATIHATCEDYRAAAGIDLEHDRADRSEKIVPPLLALWGQLGVIELCYDVLDLWSQRADEVSGRALPCGHFLAEEAPAETLEALLGFL
ncbi:alpha/beta fold hydrolase [Pelagibius marinus]|uniref:alpha/beta fold hydrolase n=1 Tax=Pelagibius marinus TaxID=2762760 RepID=UPI0018724C53|nr:alpha/beta hydrolase [Pelagibius marinus]